jgi:hypothetical protein
MMYINNTNLTPPQKLLDQCHQVLITDDKMSERPWEMKRWALQHCQSYVWFEEQDVSDVSTQWDYIFVYYFIEEQDALMFQLKYKH